MGPSLTDASVSGVSSQRMYDICEPPPHTGNQTSDALHGDSAIPRGVPVPILADFSLEDPKLGLDNLR